MRETVGGKSSKTSCKKSAKSFLDKSAKSTGLSREAVGLRHISTFWFFGFFMFFIQHCFICCPSDSNVPEDTGIEPRGRIPDKSLKCFPPCYSKSPIALRFLFLQTHKTSYSFQSVLLYTVKEKWGKPDRKPHPLHYRINPYRNL